MLTYQGWLLRPAVYVVLGFLLAILAASAVGLATQNTIVGLMMGIGVLVLVGLVLVWVARDRGVYQEASETNYTGVGIAIGIAFGVPYGVVLSTAVDNFAFLGVGVAVFFFLCCFLPLIISFLASVYRRYWQAGLERLTRDAGL